MTISLGLGRIKNVLKSLGEPQKSVKVIHIAGTNGKGSVSAYLDSILRLAGYKTGRFNSPHLVALNDSVYLSGSPCPPDRFYAVHANVQKTATTVQATPFEVLTATAFSLFASSDLDVALVEAGLGGRDDATNVVPDPLLTILTSIDLDHTAFLGDTVEAITRIKAGILKRGVPCVVAPQRHDTRVCAIVQEMADVLHAPVHFVSPARPTDSNKQVTFENVSSPAHVPLSGAHQLENSATAVLAAQQLRSLGFSAITDEHIVQGIVSTRWAGRLDWVDWNRHVRLLVDGAHNAASAQALRVYLNQNSQDTTVILALSAPKDPSVVLEPLLSGSTCTTAVIATRFTEPVEGMPWIKALDPTIISDKAKALGCTQVDISDCLSAAVALALEKHPKSRIVVAGSLYLVADVYRARHPVEDPQRAASMLQS